MIDPNEAPKGFMAVHGIQGCKGCSFDSQSYCMKMKKCMSRYRKDSRSVIFIPREKSNLGEHGDELQKAKDESLANKHAVNNLTIELAELIKKNAELEKRVENQKGRIRYLEGATSHATGTPLSKAKDEAAQWKLAHDQVCRKFADCENARDENAKLCEEAQDEAARWKAECRDLTDLVAKLKAQLTTALESIARMR